MLKPSLLRGIDIIAPSGKFWIAIPIERAIAEARVTALASFITAAKTIPIAIPSGMLWITTDNTSFVVLLSLYFLVPSSFLLLICICGTILSKENKNKIPTSTPTAAGINDNFPIFWDISIEGIINDHTAAAIITPDANPRSILLTILFISFFIA